MINNKGMKQTLLTIFIFCLAISPCFSAPNYDANKKPVIYDISSNILLRNKLEAEYDKKYLVKENENTYHYIAPLDAYEKEVVIPFAKQKKYINYDKLTEEYLNQNN